MDYERLPCRDDLADTQRFCDHYGYPLDCSANTLIVTAKTQPVTHAACVLLATTRLVSKVVRKHLGVSRISFASADDTEQLTGMALGGVTPLGLDAALPVLVDAQVMQAAFLLLGSGDRHAKIKTTPDVLRHLPGVCVLPGLARAP